MALYYDAAAVLSSSSSSLGSLRSRVYDSNNNNNNNAIIKSPPLVYGLITECARWDVVLSEVIENSGIISQEPKLTPLLAVLLVHDHLLSKRGIACPQNHPLRLATERHKARLASELTKARLRRKCATLEALRLHVLAQKNDSGGSGPQPRWIRINNLKTSFDAEIRTSLSAFTELPTLEQLCTNAAAVNAYVCDPNVPDLLATNVPTKEIVDSAAYKAGKIILQDKASCFPAHLALNSEPKFCVRSDRIGHGDLLDACAAPGNKTSHTASILGNQSSRVTGKVTRERFVFACERDAKRSETLQSMLHRAGANNTVKVLAKQDFLALDPQDQRFGNVTHLLLDPSCSGSGVVGREDVPTLVLPKNPRKRRPGNFKVPGDKATENGVLDLNKKRKRASSSRNSTQEDDVNAPPTTSPSIDVDRLRKLSNLQTRIIEHAFAFPTATVVTYSTCSIHPIENEMVALRALKSPVATRRCWRLLRRDEQPDGLRIWPHRADELDGDSHAEAVEGVWDAMTKEERKVFKEACIRCKPGGPDGTMGFFVVGFVRDPRREEDSQIGLSASNGVEKHDEEWEGLSTDEGG